MSITQNLFIQQSLNMMKNNPQKILVVDDDPHVINRIVDILSELEENYIFYQANNGETGLQIAEKLVPDIILTDWDMPIMNGIEFIKKLNENERTKTIPVVMVTAVVLSSDDLKSALIAGAIDYIRKPVDPVELTARIKSVLKISEYNKKIIENKNKEIAENALFLIRNNKFNIQIIKKLKELHERISYDDVEIDNLFEYIVNSISEKVKQDSWQRLEITFDNSQFDFKKSLLNRFPELSNTEVKLCILLRMGMNIKDLSSILFQNPESIKVARSRLRKKLKLEASQNLYAFLSSF
jgi:DNA-binding response OmpR family regulator